MKDAVFTIKTNEIVDLPDPNNTSTGIFKILKYAVWAIVALMIIFSLILGENFFFEISSSARIVLIGLVIGSFVWRDKTIEAPSPMEIRFYDDYLIVYKEKHYYNKKYPEWSIIKFFTMISHPGKDYNEIRRFSKISSFQALPFCVIIDLSSVGTRYNCNGICVHFLL